MGYDETDKLNKAWYLAGLVSFGPEDCGTAGYPGVYTRVNQYIGWIVRKLKWLKRIDVATMIHISYDVVKLLCYIFGKLDRREQILCLISLFIHVLCCSVQYYLIKII